ncbi:MAG TPA: hypothetical protein VF119_10835, partial [Candidatus Limnocylindrales bacterium]
TAFGRLSHDGRRIVGMTPGLSRNPLCVISIDGGRCEPISSPRETADLTRWTGLFWSPDDRWVLLQPIDGGTALVLDADGETQPQPDWIADGGEAWQRIAR